MTSKVSALREEGAQLTLATAWSRQGQLVLSFVRKEPLGFTSAVMLLLMVVVAAGAPFFAPHDPAAADPNALYQAPNAAYWLGTDAYGRDILSRLIYGARISLLVGLGSSLLGVIIGTLVGLLSGYWGGWLDAAVQRILDALLAFPILLLALALAAVLGPSVRNVVIALSLPIIPRAGRVVRSCVLSLKATQFIEAARALGCSDLRIVLRHILPNTVAPLLIIATAYLGLAITQEAALDYLGAGIREPQASWGLMLSGPAITLVLTAPWVAVFPGIAIFLTVLISNLLGDTLRDLLDPKLRRW